MSTYSGLCVGGIADGESLASADSVLQVVKEKPIPILRWSDIHLNASGATFVERGLYHHREITVLGGSLELWLPPGMSHAQALTRIGAVYAKATNLDQNDLRALIGASGGGKVSVGDLLK